jgi:hypothetical protein
MMSEPTETSSTIQLTEARLQELTEAAAARAVAVSRDKESVSAPTSVTVGTS